MPECKNEDQRYDYIESVFSVSEKEYATDNGLYDILMSEEYTNGTYYSTANEDTQDGMKELFDDYWNWDGLK